MLAPTAGQTYAHWHQPPQHTRPSLEAGGSKVLPGQQRRQRGAEVAALVCDAEALNVSHVQPVLVVPQPLCLLSSKRRPRGIGQHQRAHALLRSDRRRQRAW